MSVLELCDPEAATVPAEATVADAIRKMLDFHVGAVAVIDSEKRVAGIFTERDVLRKFSLSGRDPEKTLVPVTNVGTGAPSSSNGACDSHEITLRARTIGSDATLCV